jgi:hypothetical protein
MMQSILKSKINPAIMIPILEEALQQERLNCDANDLLNNDSQVIKSELKISQLELLICLLRFKA